MKEISHKEHIMQAALGTLSKYIVQIEKPGEPKPLYRITVEAANQVDALHKAWTESKRTRKKE